MKLSFVIPAYNEEKVLPKCLESLQKEIGRAVEAGEVMHDDIEVVVVNNASTDRTKEVAQSFSNVRVVDESRKGLVWARKAGFDATSGELVANVDADTLLPEGWLSTVLDQFKNRPHLAALSGPFIYYDLGLFQRALVKAWYFPGWLFNLLFEPIGRATMLQGGNFVFKRSAWQKVGGFDTSIIFFGEDADVARRIRSQGRVRWTWRLPMYTSGRRLTEEGFLRTGWRYFVNLLATHTTGKPYSSRYTDIRPK